MLHRDRRFALLPVALASTAALAILAAGMSSRTDARVATKSISLNPAGTYETGVPFDGDVGAAEIPAYDPLRQRVFVVNAVENQIDVLDISTPSTPSKIGSIELAQRPNSVAVSGRLLAVALEADQKTDPGPSPSTRRLATRTSRATASHSRRSRPAPSRTCSPSPRAVAIYWSPTRGSLTEGLTRWVRSPSSTCGGASGGRSWTQSTSPRSMAIRSPKE